MNIKEGSKENLVIWLSYISMLYLSYLFIISVLTHLDNLTITILIIFDPNN